jgi:hypothetical protein
VDACAGRHRQPDLDQAQREVGVGQGGEHDGLQVLLARAHVGLPGVEGEVVPVDDPPGHDPGDGLVARQPGGRRRQDDEPDHRRPRQHGDERQPANHSEGSTSRWT